MQTNASVRCEIQHSAVLSLPRDRCGARLCPQDQSQRVRKRRDFETIATCRSVRACCGWASTQPRSGQSQRDCVLQPKVARNELPWVIVEQTINRNAVAAILFSSGGRVT